MSEQPPSGPPTREERVGELLTAWQRELADLGGPNTLLWYRDGDLTLDLTRAHPAGVARFLAAGRIRLSELFREPGAFEEASRRAWAIRRHTARLSQQRGLTCAYLAIGLATWSAPKGQRQAQAPVLLRQIRLEPVGMPMPPAVGNGTGHGGPDLARLLVPGTPPLALGAWDDLALELGTRIELNPVLVSYLQRGRGIPVDVAAVEALAGAESVGNPYSAYAELGRICQSVPGFEISPRQVISLFPSAKMAHVADLAEQRPVLLASDVVAALAGVPDALPPDAALPPAADNPDLADEILVLDADAGQRAAVDAVRRGGHVSIVSPAGTGATQTVANLLAALSADGRSVLLLCEDQRQITRLADRLAQVGLADLLLAFPAGGTDRTRVVRELALTLERRRTDRPAVRRGDQGQRTDVVELTRLRQQLVDHAEMLHRVHQPWNVSAYQVQNEVIRLQRTLRTGGSTVRLTDQTLAATPREELLRLIEEVVAAARIGGWASGEPDPWYGARITSREEVERAGSIVGRLTADELASVAARIGEVLTESGLPAGETVAQWERATETLIGVQQTLELFRPDIFYTDLREHIVAADESNEIGWAARARIRRETRSLLRPGPPPADLRGALQAATDQRAVWRELVGPGARPQASARVHEAAQALASVLPDLQWLTERLTGTPGAPDLLELPVPELAATLAQLAARPDRLAVLPDVVGTLDDVGRAGFSELVADLAARGVTPDELADEIEYVWWSSLVRQLAQDDPQYGGHDGAALHAALEAYQAADRAHQAGSAERVRRAVAEHALRADKRVISALSRAVDAPPPVPQIVQAAGPGLMSIAPVWAMSPLVVPEVVPSGRWFDTVVVLDAGSTTPARVAAGLARAGSVVLVGDPTVPDPTSFLVSAEGLPVAKGPVASLQAALRQLPTRRLEVIHAVRDGRLFDVVNRQAYDGQLTFAPAPPGEPAVRLDLVDGVAPVPTGDDAVIETTDAEVAHVVALVGQHVRTKAHETLVVLGLNDVHVAALRGGLAAAALADAMPGGVPIAVVAASGCAGLVADVAIVSVGFGRTRHGRVIHRFPSLAEPGADRVVLSALTVARRRTVVVSALSASDLDDDRLTSAGATMLKRVLGQLADDLSPQAEPESRDAPDATAGPTRDAPLDGDGLAPVLAEFADRLRAEGLAVQAGPSQGHGRIALVVTDPEQPDRPPVAVLADGPAYAEVGSVRDRDRLFGEALLVRGWSVVPVWTTDLFRDPMRDIVRVLSWARRPAPVGIEAPSDEVQTEQPVDGSEPDAPMAQAEAEQPVAQVEQPVAQAEQRVDEAQTEHLADGADELEAGAVPAGHEATDLVTTDPSTAAEPDDGAPEPCADAGSALVGEAVRAGEAPDDAAPESVAVTGQAPEVLAAAVEADERPASSEPPERVGHEPVAPASERAQPAPARHRRDPSRGAHEPDAEELGEDRPGRAGLFGRRRRGRRRVDRPATAPGTETEPGSTLDDTDQGWGEREDAADRDTWLQEQRPPHWE